MGLPTWVAAGTVTGSTGALTPTMPAGFLAADILLLVCQSSPNQNVTLSTANGFAQTASSPQNTNIAGGTHLTVFWKRAVGSDDAPVIADPGDHIVAVMCAVRGVRTTGNPWNITSGNSSTVSNTAVSITGETTTAANCLVVAITTDGGVTSTLSGWANGDLASVTERVDGGSGAGAGGHIGIATGTKAAAGAYDATTATLTSLQKEANMTLALEGAVAVSFSDTVSLSGGPAAIAVAAKKSASSGAVAFSGGGFDPLGLGVYDPTVNKDSLSPGPALDAFAVKVGTPPRIVHWFQTWNSNNPYKLVFPTVMDAVTTRGATPMITWMPYTYKSTVNSGVPSLADIASGTEDTYLAAAAAEAQAYGKPFFVRPFHEMNGNWMPWAVGVFGNTAAQLVAAWRHVVDIFRAAGATNAKFVFSPNIIGSASPDFTPMYPGDGYVHWVALDGYNRGNILNVWQTFPQVLQASYDTLTALTTKPLMIAETASSEDGGNKATWITTTFKTDIPANFPRIKAVVWFNEQKASSWPVDSSSAALTAYRAAAAAFHGGTDVATDKKNAVASRTYP